MSDLLITFAALTGGFLFGFAAGVFMARPEPENTFEEELRALYGKYWTRARRELVERERDET